MRTIFAQIAYKRRDALCAYSASCGKTLLAEIASRMLCNEDQPDSGGFRFSLRALFAGVTLAAFGCLVISLVAPIFDVPGVLADLPLAERQTLDAMQADGIAVQESRGKWDCGFNRKCRVLVRSTGEDERYHVTAVQLRGFSDFDCEQLTDRLRKLPELAAIRVLPGWGGDNLLEMLRRDLPSCRVEHWSSDGSW